VRLARATGLPSGEDPLARGWLAGLEEASRLLERLAPGAVRWGSAFGVRWPYVAGDGWAVAPGVPVPAGPEPVEGPDGIYTFESGGILREAVGAGELFVELSPPEGAVRTARPDLLWFGPTERYVLKGGALEVEDLFSRAIGPIGAAALAERLVRRGRFREDLVAGLPGGEASGPGRVEIRRPLDLVSARWENPAELFSRREGVRKVHRVGHVVVVELEDGALVEAAITETGAGWNAEIVSGAFSWRQVTTEASGGMLHYRVVPAVGLDPLDTAVRTRIAFDLLSDLVQLGT
jgi:hypothetical protein